MARVVRNARDIPYSATVRARQVVSTDLPYAVIARLDRAIQ